MAEITAAHPGQVTAVPFCAKPFGCAFDEMLTDPRTVYVKIDDDTTFIKDGSIEHLALECLINHDYSFFTASVVNHPHSAAVHRYVGALPPSSYHWTPLAKAQPPFYEPARVPVLYFGNNIYEHMGSPAHEAFVYNIAHNRLDVYTFDVWNMNACRCAEPQENLLFCEEGYYRWNINAFAWTRNRTSEYKGTIPAFDEPVISMWWSGRITPGRAGMVGEALFVHAQYTKQRHSPADWGLREDVLLPWYYELARQYTAAPYGGWQGNQSLLALYESMQEGVGEVRGSGKYNLLCRNAVMALEKEQCATAGYS